MNRIAVVLTTIVLPALAAPHTVRAQDQPALVPVKLQLVVSRFAGEKKVSSLPYTLWVTANEAKTTNARMGVRVPVPTTVADTKEGEAAKPLSYSYQQVGTTIDCTARTGADGLFRVYITLNDNSLHYDAKSAPGGTPSAIAGVPAFRNFTSTFAILLKDGQTAQYSSATDPQSGEVLRVDVTLNVLK